MLILWIVGCKSYYYNYYNANSNMKLNQFLMFHNCHVNRFYNSPGAYITCYGAPISVQSIPVKELFYV